MDDNGRRFKSKKEQESVTEAEPVEFGVTDRSKAERRNAKQSKKIEKMLSKKRSKPQDEAVRPSDDSVPLDADSVVLPDPEDEEDEKKRSDEKDERLRQKNAKKLEKLMQKQRRREDKSDREVLTYEEMPLEERAAEKKKSKVKFKRRRIILAGVIVLLLAVLVFLFTNSDRLSMHNIVNFIKYGVFNLEPDQRYPVQIRDENVSAGNFLPMGQDLCYATDTRLQTLNNYGVSMLSLQHGYSRPYLVTSNKYALLFDLGGVNYQINSLDQQIFAGKAESNILAADILNSGTYALVTEADGYLAKLSVYDDDNDLIFAYSFSEYSITSVTLKSNGRMAVLSGVSAHNGTEISSLFVLDFTKESPVQFVELKDTILYAVQYMGSSYAAAVGSRGAYVIDMDSGEVNSTDFEGKTLTDFTFNTDTDTFTVSLSRSGDGRNCDVYSFSKDGSLDEYFSTDLRVISLSTYKNRVALLTTDTIYLYSKSGEKLGEAESGIDPQSVVLYTTVDAYILDTSEIRTVSM